MKIFCFFLCLFQSFILHATESRNGLWYGFFNEAEINERFAWWTEAQLRHDVDAQRLQQTLVRTGLLMQVTEYSNLGLLYAYVDSDPFKEHRITFQHVLIYGDYFNSNLSQRVRLEYRTLENNRNLPWRFRYSFRVEKNTSFPIKPSLKNEVFLNLKRDPYFNNSIFDRNRLFIGGRYPFKENINIEFGYLNQYTHRPQRDLTEHLLVFYLFYLI